MRSTRARAGLCLALPLVFWLGANFGCNDTQTARGPRECAPASPLPLDRLTLEGAREAHRRAELRRHLRFMEAVTPGYTTRMTAPLVEQERVSAGQVCFSDIYEVGRILFEHEYSFADGLGGGQARSSSQGPFRRVQRGAFGGPETNSCTSCHWRGGPGGAGGVQDNSYLLGDGDWVSSSDGRNPPPLHGAGVVQVLADEMTGELHAIRAAAIRRARGGDTGVTVPLVAKGVEFGTLSVSADGAVDTSGVSGVDPDLVIRPFGWKGNFGSIREFVAESLHVHFNIQSDELIAMHRTSRNNSLVGPGKNVLDPDDDGLENELSHGQQTALVVYIAALEMPIIEVPEPLHDMPARADGLIAPTAMRFHEPWARGRQLFDELGCAVCHRPMMVLASPRFSTRTHEDEVYEFDLASQSEEPRPAYDAALGGYPVWLFSDLKRHDMGPENAARHIDHGVAKAEYMTRRLWGLAQSGPYFYDGRAPDLDTAILAHGGEAEYARDAFAALAHEDKGAVRVYLMSLRRKPRVIIP
jgi:hypothetical protein